MLTFKTADGREIFLAVHFALRLPGTLLFSIGAQDVFC